MNYVSGKHTRSYGRFTQDNVLISRNLLRSSPGAFLILSPLCRLSVVFVHNCCFCIYTVYHRIYSIRLVCK